MKEFDLNKIDFGSFSVIINNNKIKEQNEASLAELLKQGIITSEQKEIITNYIPERAGFQIKELQKLTFKPSQEQFDQIDREAEKYYFNFFKENNKQLILQQEIERERAEEIKRQGETSPKQVEQKREWLDKLREKAKESIPPRPEQVLQLPFDATGACTKEHVIESLKAAGLYQENLYVRIFRSKYGLQNALENGTDRSNSSLMFTTGYDGEQRAMKEHGITDQSQVTFVTPLKEWSRAWEDSNKKSPFGDAVIVFRGEALTPLEPSYKESGTSWNGFSTFVVDPLDAVVAVFHSNAPHKSVPTTGMHTQKPEAPIKGSEITTNQKLKS